MKTRPLSDEDTSFITDEQSISYIQSLQKRMAKIECKLPSMDGVPEPVQYIMARMLEFNHFFRGDASELLKDPIFDKYRKADKEKPCPTKIEFEYDDPQAFDYEKIVPKHYTIDDLYAAL